MIRAEAAGIPAEIEKFPPLGHGIAIRSSHPSRNAFAPIGIPIDFCNSSFELGLHLKICRNADFSIQS